MVEYKRSIVFVGNASTVLSHPDGHGPTSLAYSAVNRVISQPDQYSSFTSDLNNIPYIYGLPKTHKPGIPLRPIIAYHLSPAYKLSKYLSGYLTPLVKASPQSSAIRDIPSFVQSVNSLCPVPNTVMVSYDVVAMYLSLPHQLIIRQLTKFLQDNQVDPRTAESIVALSSLCLDFTTFTFNNLFFKQIRGSPMGSPLSSPLAEIVMANIDHWIQQQITPGIHMWRRYIDDIFAYVIPDKKSNWRTGPYCRFLIYWSYVLPLINTLPYTARLTIPHSIQTSIPHIYRCSSSGGSVYSVSCNDCSASYIGETGRSVAIRMTEHGRCIANKDNRSLIFNHINTTGHSFNLSSPTTLYSNVNTKYQRLIIEAILSITSENLTAIIERSDKRDWVIILRKCRLYEKTNPIQK
ncbi:hypothetical protein LAZ67_16002141 [Cordylochernes scorpioides]|uniref:Reverse transcriptase domain-containing protein n=1 Tax=Cordylochernes scorpioides TaxID=51811 RepID=A0ABY6LBT2_9ARAC|nr:hypothetical protein LAZ67_16002141 [Cordylochernes scorpioides]